MLAKPPPRRLSRNLSDDPPASSPNGLRPPEGAATPPRVRSPRGSRSSSPRPVRGSGLAVGNTSSNAVLAAGIILVRKPEGSELEVLIGKYEVVNALKSERDRPVANHPGITP